jgi:hypothetical protein
MSALETKGSPALFFDFSGKDFRPEAFLKNPDATAFRL